MIYRNIIYTVLYLITIFIDFNILGEMKTLSAKEMSMANGVLYGVCVWRAAMTNSLLDIRILFT